MTLIKTDCWMPLAKLASSALLLTAIVMVSALPVWAQDGTGPPPENAHERTYNGGWDCDIGFRLTDGLCVQLDLPANSYATGRSYGTGWACRRGFEEVEAKACAAIFVPENAFLRSSGFDWQCERGYREDQDMCVTIELPDHAYLTGEPSGSGWACNRGFMAEADRCIPIAVPANGYLTNSEYGAAWACERGFGEIDGRCDAVAVPATPSWTIGPTGRDGAVSVGMRPKAMPASNWSCPLTRISIVTAMRGAATGAFE
ncbi:hypothetical protein [Oceaniradius stylonematis]|uniref:hypothetical protein n=1 Tax=Oceaniradius stylonematis TaxID=2184161 RepID=UPI00273EB6D6|nr:hypothetical protein [Oceaniradius stylonematis]